MESDAPWSHTKCTTRLSFTGPNYIPRPYMNWTGGRLQRHSGPAKGHGGQIHRQRLHFAKARAQNCYRQPNTHVFEPGPSIFFSPSPANAHHTRPLTNRPRTLHQHETASTLAHYQSFTKGPTPAADNGDQHNGDERTHRQFESSGDLSLDSSARLKAEKTRLLKSRDWAGLASSRPLHMAFASGKEDRDIGKRHNAKRQKRLSYEGRKSLATTSKHAQETDNDGPYMSGAILDDDDIRIRIGTDVLATQSLEETNHSLGIKSPSARSSDEMLFDVEARRETLRSQDAVFWGHNIELRSSKGEQAGVQYAAGFCEAERPLDNVQFNDSDAPLADVDLLLQQLEETPPRFPIQHEYSSSAAHILGSVHASPDELEKGDVNYRGLHDDNATMQSPDYESFGKSHSAFQAYGHGVLDSVAIRGILSPRSVHLTGTLTPGALDTKGSKATLLEESNEMRSRRSTAQPLLYETNGNAEPAPILDDIAWKKFVHANSDMAAQSLDMQRSHCGDPGAHEGKQSSHITREIDQSYHVHSGDIPLLTESAARPIGDGRRMHSRDFEQENYPTVRNVEGGAAADGADRARIKNLHMQIPPSSAAAAVVKTCFPAATPHQTGGFAKNATPRRGMISDPAVDAAETVWKRFVLGRDLCEAQDGECESPERALKSTEASIGASQERSFSSLSVQSSLGCASASAPFRPLEACSHSTVEKSREPAEAAAAREVLEDSTDQWPMSMAVERSGNSTADSLSTNYKRDTLDDGEDTGSSNVNLQSNQAVAPDSTGHVPGRGKRVLFSKPKPFASSTATSKPESVKTGQENSQRGSATRIGPLRIQQNREWSLSRYSRRFKKLTELETVED